MQLYNFEIKYIPDKEVALADAVSRVNPQDEMRNGSWFHYTGSNPKHDTNTDANDKWWT